MDGLYGFACTMLEYLVHSSIRAIASAQISINVQGELQGAMTSVISLSLIFGSVFYVFLFECFTDKNALFYFSGAPFVGGFFLLVVATAIFALRVR